MSEWSKKQVNSNSRYMIVSKLHYIPDALHIIFKDMKSSLSRIQDRRAAPYCTMYTCRFGRYQGICTQDGLVSSPCDQGLHQ